MAATAKALRYRVEGMDCPTCAGKVETAVKRLPGVSDVQVSATTQILTFRAGSQGVKALPLAFINRIEMVRPADIERSAGRLVVRRDDGLLALLPLIEGSPLREPEQPVLIVEISGHTFGLLVDEIVDIVDAAPDVAVPGATPCALGVADIDGTITEFVNAAQVTQGAMRAGSIAQLEMTP